MENMNLLTSELHLLWQQAHHEEKEPTDSDGGSSSSPPPSRSLWQTLLVWRREQDRPPDQILSLSLPSTQGPTSVTLMGVWCGSSWHALSFTTHSNLWSRYSLTSF